MGSEQIREGVHEKPPFEVVFVVKTGDPIERTLSHGDDVQVSVGAQKNPVGRFCIKFGNDSILEFVGEGNVS